MDFEGRARLSLPIRVRCGSQLRPTQVITLSARKGRRAENVTVDVNGLRLPWGVEWGDPVTTRPVVLVENATIDIVLNVSRNETQSLYVLSEGIDREIVSRDDILLRISWGELSPTDPVQAFGLLWRASDRMRGKPPIIVDRWEMKRLTGLPSSAPTHVPRVFSRRFPRVRRPTRADLRRRDGHTQEKVMNSVGSSPIRARSLTFRGLRGFRDDETLRLAIPNGTNGSGLTIVVGQNNAGKSTVWEAFDSLARKMVSDVSFSEGRRNRHSGGVHIRLERVDGSSYLLESRHAETSETRSRWEPEGNVADTSFELVSVPARRQFQPNFGKSGSVERNWMIATGEYSRARQSDQFMQFTGRLFDLHNDEVKKRRFDELMKEVLGKPLEWSIDLSDGQFGQSYYLKVVNGDESHTSDGLGDGIISLMFILNALYDSEPGTVLTIDEPELSLHPQLIRRLGRVISRLAADRQIVIFTHSPHLVSWADLAAGGEVARVYRRSHGSHIAQASRSAIDGVTRVRGGWSNPHALGLDATAALFLDDGLIVVEGQEDAALLPRVFTNLGLEFKGSIFGWGSGGATNIERFLALLKELQFSRVVALLDNDVPEVAANLRALYDGYLVIEQPAADIRDKRFRPRPSKSGLLDERGRAVKPELELAATEMCLLINDFVTLVED